MGTTRVCFLYRALVQASGFRQDRSEANGTANVLPFQILGIVCCISSTLLGECQQP